MKGMTQKATATLAALALAAALLAGCAAKPRAEDGRVAIQVTEDGFVPASVTVPVGRPVTLVVTRTTDRTCATALVMPAMSIKRELPLNQAVEITFTPDHAGTLDYACGMDMIRGKVVVK